MKIGLGTAQLGLDYGIANPRGRTPRAEAREILALAHARGVRVLDTAPVYGDAEIVLGELAPTGHEFRVVTKALSCEDCEGSFETLASCHDGILRRSLDRLGVPAADAVLVHRPDDLLAPEARAVFASLERLRESGLARRIGVSVYTPRQLRAITARFPLDVVQVPLNVLDQRLLDGGDLDRLHASGVEIHARSAFLQGLLLMSPRELPPAFSALAAPLAAFHEAAAREGITPLAAALGFVLAQEAVANVICGVDSREQLDEILDAAGMVVDPHPFRGLALDDDRWLDPSRWPLEAR